MQNLLDFSHSQPFRSFFLGLVEILQAGEEADFVQGVVISEGIPDKPPEQPARVKFGEIYVKICVLPKHQTTGLFQSRIADYAARQQFVTIIAERELAVLYTTVDGGTPLNSGTLGGMLQDQISGDYFGLTCSHVARVAGQTAALGDVRSTPYPTGASVVATNHALLAASALSPGKICNPLATSPAPTNILDVALIQLNPILTATNEVRTIGPVSAFLGLPHLSTGDNVIMRGAGSGLGNYRLGGLCVTYKLAMASPAAPAQGQYLCFANLLETYTHSSLPLPAWMGRAFFTVPKPRDSGAWIFRPRQNFANAKQPHNDLCAMLIGGNGTNGFAHFIDPLLLWAKALTPSRVLQTF